MISWIVGQTGLNPQGNLASQLNGIIFGGLLILTMLFAPLGIVGASARGSCTGSGACLDHLRPGSTLT